MIMVDIYFPVVDSVYNFKLDEHSKISSLVQEVSEMMCKKYKSAFDRTKESYLLCLPEQNKILDGEATLSSYGVRNGSRLLIV